MPTDRRFPPSVKLTGIGVMAVCLLTVISCGPRTYPVKGKVVWKDGTVAKEIAGATVLFESDEAKVVARGNIREDGTFTLGTFAEGGGVVPSKYRVAVVPDDEMFQIMDPRFKDLKASRLEVVVDSAKNDVVIQVEKLPGGPRHLPPPR
jgi:hypothetical protein